MKAYSTQEQDGTQLLSSIVLFLLSCRIVRWWSLDFGDVGDSRPVLSRIRKKPLRGWEREGGGGKEVIASTSLLQKSWICRTRLTVLFRVICFNDFSQNAFGRFSLKCFNTERQANFCFICSPYEIWARILCNQLTIHLHWFTQVQ